MSTHRLLVFFSNRYIKLKAKPFVPYLPRSLSAGFEKTSSGNVILIIKFILHN